MKAEPLNTTNRPRVGWVDKSHGYCNCCVDSGYLRVYQIDLRGLQFRLCRDCCVEMIKQIKAL
jgi:hypothetical protein